MLEGILPNILLSSLTNVDLNKVNEIRLRLGSPIVINGDKQYYLSKSGLTQDRSEGIIVHSKIIEDILLLTSDNSMYAVNDQLIEGYITKNGIRIGVSGEVVQVNGSIKTLKNITSLNIRIPHHIKNCSLQVYNLLASGQVKNTLVISPPGAGKTTFLRDLIMQLDKRLSNKSILVVDERNEIISFLDCDLKNVDVYKNSSKEYAFNNGIRSMKPDVIVTDEINLSTDIDAIENAITSGVSVIASIHATNINDLKNKRQFSDVIQKQLFTRYVVLGFSNGVGTIEGVYNESFRCIYL